MIVLIFGIFLMIAAVSARQSWLDAHFLPSFLISRAWYVAIETAVRAAAAVAGASMALLHRLLTSFMRNMGWLRLTQVTGAALLALAASEAVLQRVHLRPAEWQKEAEEPRRIPDARLGWIFEPARTAHATNRGGQSIEYAFDANGYRVRNARESIDLKKPSNLFVGESVLFGDGLAYDDSVPAQVEAALGVQSINAAVYGYSTDQTYLKLERELRRVQHPAAVVALFMTALFGRNLDDDRPHLGAALSWQPAVQHGRLMTLAGLIVPFRRGTTVRSGVAVTREVLRGIADLARAHGAAPLVVVPTIGPESAPERALREQLLDDPAVPFVLVELDPAWHIPWDHHPDARAAHELAAAVARRLQQP